MAIVEHEAPSRSAWGRVAPRQGRHAVIEQLLADGVKHIFGNPGTVEQGLLDALSDYPQLEYILALQESIAVGQADGYARATGKPTIVQLHSGVGLGNGIGMLYQAKRGHAPLVVLAGESGVMYDAMDAQMAADLVAMARPVTKWATRVVDASSVLRVLRRAVKMAATPPMGPVFVCLPMDVLDALTDEPAIPTPALVTRVAPEPEQVERAADMLAAAERPMLIVGDGIAFSGAQAELTRVAELLGAEVWGADWGEVNFAQTHPLFRGQLGHMFGEHSREIVTGADGVLISGTYVFPEVFPTLAGAFAPDARVVHVDLDAYEIAKNFPVDLGLVADPKLTLGRLGDALEARLGPAQREAARQRMADLGEAKRRVEAAAREADSLAREEMPLHAARFMEELARALPSDAIIFDEALTTSPALTRYIPADTPGQYYATRGGSLGVGIPGALGIKLAHPDRTVVGFTGDGGSMYTIQALWTAAHHRIGAKLVICNNGSYQLLKDNVLQYWREREIEPRSFPVSFDLLGPPIRFDEMARSMGVPGLRVDRPDQVSGAVREALATDGPFLIDLVTHDPSAPSGR